MDEQSIEERVAQLENKVADLERQRMASEERDIALLARIDNFIDDLRRVERVQMRAFDTLMAGQKNLEAAVGVIVETLKDHKQAIESLAGQMNDQAKQIHNLATGQAQILAILTGQKRND